MNSSVPKGPKGQWFLGNGLQFGRDPLGFLERSGRNYGDAVRLRFGTTIVYLLSNPELVESVLDGSMLGKILPHLRGQ
jgi:hypothetical protein